ncbi:MAG: hypothetical protein ABI822_33830, partial [Bryobacteraceae bacterium]
DGNLWFTEYYTNMIGRITPARVITHFPIPSGGIYGAYGIALGADGNIWFTECRCSSGASGTTNIGNISPTGVITEFPVPGGTAPFSMTAGPDGNLWFTELGTNKIGRITTAGVITGEFTIPTASSDPEGITAGPDGNMWFTESNGNNIGRITPAGVITEFPVPSAGSYPYQIAPGPDGSIWFTEYNGNKIGKVVVDTIGPLTSQVTVNPSPLAVNASANLTARVDDSSTGGGNIASASYTVNGGSASSMVVTPSAAVTAQATAILAPFSADNVYNVCVHGTDSAGNTGADSCVLLPVYDPSAGFVTGGGQVASPAGADLSHPAAPGQATFGFVSKYLPGRNVPSGNLEFQFKEGNLNFKSTSMDWLVVTGQPRARFHGTGTVNGTEVCNFEVDAWAGSAQPDNVDAFGLKITACTNGGDRYVLPATPLTHGNIIIHK